jgi:hypothetical protein
MADNTELNPGTGGDVIASDDIGGVKHQRVKVSLGADGTAVDAVAGAGAVGTGVQRVTLASDDPAVTALQLLDNAIAGNEMQVDVVAPLPAGTNVIGALSANQSVNVAQMNGVTTTMGNGASGTGVQRVTIASDSTGVLASVGAISTSVTPGTSAAHLGKAEDAAHGNGDTGVMALAVRRDADTSLVGADNDYAPLQVNASGSLKVAITSGAGSGGTSIADGASFTRDTTSVTPVAAVVETSAPTLTNGDAAALSMTTGGALRTAVVSGGIQGVVEDAAATDGVEGVAVMAVRRDTASSGVSADGDYAMLSVTSDGSLRVSGGGGGTQYAEDAAHTSGDTGTMALAVRRDTAASGASADGDYATLNVNSSGRLYVEASLAASQTLATVTTLTGTTTLTPGTGAANLGKAEDAVHASGDVGVMALAVRQDTRATLASATGDYVPFTVDATGGLYTNAQGPVAHDGVVSGNPVRIAGRALTADYTAVAAGDVADFATTLTGKQVVYPHALPGATWSYAAASGGITNTTAVTVKTAAGAGIRNYVTSLDVVNGHATVSTEVMIRDGAGGTVLWRGFAAAVGGGVSREFVPPLRGTANTLLEVVNVTTGAATYFNLSGFAAAE